MQQSDGVGENQGESEVPFALPASVRKRQQPNDLIDLIRPPVPTAADDEFWTSRPYKPDAREANLIALGIGVLGLLILGVTRWFPVFLACTGGLGLAAILAGTILNLAHYENPWWRVPSLLAIGCGVIELANIAIWLGSTGP